MTALTPPSQHVTIVWQAGDDTPATIPVPGPAGAPVDLTGWQATVTVVHNGREVHRWDSADGSAETGPAGVTLLADDSQQWAWWRGRFTLRVESPTEIRRTVTGDMLVRASPTAARPAVPTEPVDPVGPETLTALHGDSWYFPAFGVALHGDDSTVDDLTGWHVRAELRADGPAVPLLSWSSVLPPTADPRVDLVAQRSRLSSGALVELPAIVLRIEPADWAAVPRDWSGLLEVELTRGPVDTPTERHTIVRRRPFRVVPDLLR